IYRAAYFGVYDTAKYVFAKDGKKLNFFASWGIAQVITVGSGILSYPWDTERRRMIMQFDRKKLLYKNTLGCAIRIIKNKGMPTMFKIAPPRRTSDYRRYHGEGIPSEVLLKEKYD
ncbi:hypothetical protein PFISCL1PPCAC_7649, partial [Pristionchus fissidentatus]